MVGSGKCKTTFTSTHGVRRYFYKQLHFVIYFYGFINFKIIFIRSCRPNIDDDSSDGITFLDSKGEVAEYEDEGNSTDGAGRRTCSPRPNKQIMYIQMEFCEKSTLR